jgi:hypothetical protein
MTTTDHTPLITECCLGYPDAEPCKEPVRFYALAACAPDLWNESAGASLGGYCCREHADAELRPSLAEAQRTYAEVVDACGSGHPAPEAWRRLIDAYPDPVPVKAGIA